MWLKLVASEWSYLRRLPSFYIVSALFFLLAFLAMTVDNVQIAIGGPNVMQNGPWYLAIAMVVFSIFGMFVVANFVGNTATRDVTCRMDGIILATPVSRGAYLWGRLTGAYLITMLVFCAIPLGLLLGSLMPWVDAERFGPTVIAYYIWPVVVLVAPSLFFCAVLFYALAMFSRSMMGMYLGVVAFFVLYLISGSLLSEPEYRTIGALADPFASSAYMELTRYWTAIERNTEIVSFDGVLLYNRLLWLGLAALIILVCQFTLDPRRPLTGRSARKRQKQLQPESAPALTGVSASVQLDLPNVHQQRGFSSWLPQLVRQTRFEVSQIVKSAPFVILLLITMVMLGSALLLGTNTTYGTANWPFTRLMVDEVMNATSLLAMIVVIYYSAESVWRERQSGMGDIVDATPTHSSVFFLSKLAGLLVVLVGLCLAAVVVTVLFQLSKGITHLELGQYALRLGLWYLLPMLMTAVLAIFVQVLSPNKFAGIGIMVVFMILLLTLNALGLEHNMYAFSGAPTHLYSDINGYGHYIAPQLWYMLYWGGLTLVLAVLAYTLWRRGAEARLKDRSRHLLSKLGWSGGAMVSAGLLAFVIAGTVIVHNTRILNEFTPSKQGMDVRAEYEKELRPYHNLAVPSITAVDLEVELYPQQRSAVAVGEFVLQNQTDEPIARMLVQLPQHSSRASSAEVRVEGARMSDIDSRFNTQWAEFDTPLAPGDETRMSFRVERTNQGFVDRGADVSLLHNGTFINNFELLPALGYQARAELQDRHERRKRDLPARHPLPDLDDEAQNRINAFTGHTHYIDFNVLVSTELGQTAIAPGYLTEQWDEGERAYFRYAMDAPILNFFNLMSADLEVTEDEHDGVAISVYHHARHDMNVGRMIDGVKDSLDYFNVNFGPYQHRQLRIIEFPYRSFAQAFPNTVPFSENMGFALDLRDEESIDFAYYVTAHEVAHQWFAHQITPGNVQGGQVLSETLSQYGALMVMEHSYGEEAMRRFLKRELDRYLSARSFDVIGESPLYRVESQAYIYYQKGSLVMYALRDYLGEEAVNTALRNLIDEFQYAHQPYPNTRDLIRLLREQATDEQQVLITDMFERIVLFDLQTTDAEMTELDNGRWQLSLTIEAQKLEADSMGQEESVDFTQSFDIGALRAHPDNINEADEVLYLEKHQISRGTNNIVIELDERPAFAGIDPFVKLISRDVSRNVRAVR
ncbi:MAG: ABC transporter permease [Idiomarina sp.]|nr:ABC transporter permease [Idiomarina sp.]